MNHPTLQDLRRHNHYIAQTLTGLMAWTAFTLDGFQAALAARLGGQIVRLPFHWQEASLFGLTLGAAGPDGPRWLVLYEAETDAEHQLVIILHELMHIAFKHSRADVAIAPEQIHTLLAAAGLATNTDAPLVYTRACRREQEGPTSLSVREAAEEYEAELAATWVLTQARRAGALPPPGQAFSLEHQIIDANLRCERRLP